jgi:hypothetical protein
MESCGFKITRTVYGRSILMLLGTVPVLITVYFKELVGVGQGIHVTSYHKQKELHLIMVLVQYLYLQITEKM